MKQIKNLSELLVEDLRNLYAAEKTQVNALPTLTKNVHSQELRSELKNQADRKKTRVQNLEKAFSILNHKPVEEKNPVMSQIIDAGLNRIKNITETNISDAGVISTVQNANHYGIANYGTACAYARATGHDDVAKILHTILEEEKQADEHLSTISEGKVLTKTSPVRRG
jgi:ferritin-like metal-binding protein YciE